MSKFKNGDLVRIKSGGPAMTVQILRPDDFVFCCWFVGDELRQDTFQEDALMVVAIQEPEQADGR